MAWWDDFTESIGDFYNDTIAKGLGDLYEGFKDWSGFDDDDEAKALYWLSNVPIAGDVISSNSKYDYLNDYLNNKGMSWSDLRYIGMNGLTTSGNWYSSASDMYNFVSDNIVELYK